MLRSSQFAVLFSLLAYGSTPAQTRVLDSFDSVSGWSAHPSEGVELKISRDSGFNGPAMRLDYDFRAGGGYAIARKAVALDLPANYEFSFRLKANASTNDLEFKLVDPSGDNVWWLNRRAYEFPRDWTRLVTKKRHITFAWGPVGGGEMSRVGAVEIVITAGTGGKGSVWVDDFTFTARDPVTTYSGTPIARSSSVAPGNRAAHAIDGDTGTTWRSAAGGRQHFTIDFGSVRELGGFEVDWQNNRHATRYDVQQSADGARWETLYSVKGGDGSTDFIALPELETRYLRLELVSGNDRRGYAIRDINVKPVAWSASPNAFFEHLAKQAPRGTYPKYLNGEQSYWTVVGATGDTREALVNEEGAIEIDKGSFSIEPFLLVDDTLVTWNDARLAQSLERGDLPIPSVRWEGGPFALTVTAFAGAGPLAESDTGIASASLWARYRVANTSASPRRATLYLALRPFQVNPSWQFLNTQGGVTHIREISYAAGVVEVNGSKLVASISKPAGFGAAAFDHGDITEYLRRGSLPASTSLRDHTGYASAALSYAVDLAPGASRDFWIAVPFHASTPANRSLLASNASSDLGEERLATATSAWSERLDRVRLKLPPSAERIVSTLRSNLAYILINRDGPSIQPGSRSYDRSWIRDGSLTSAALLRLGHEREVREFIEWFAPFQFPSGKVPCCVDSRGADAVPENDSHGQLIFAIAEYWRFTNDTAFARRMWPHVTYAVTYMDSLRHLRMTPVYRGTDSLRAFYGMLPESISHEGYSAKPMHSYWDDFFALKGLKDAAMLAVVLGDSSRAKSYASMRDEFRVDLLSSFRLAMAWHRIDYLPGSVELGDFDATSTTVGVSPAEELHTLPRNALQRTFDRYYEEAVARRDGKKEWDGYTPYEWRTVGTFVRLGDRKRAHYMLDFFFGDRRPAEWNHWAEVVWRDPKTPKFIGDMPHTWVGSDFIRSVLDMFAFERESDSSLVVGAGIRPAWVNENPGVAIQGLRTHYGSVDVTIQRMGRDVRVNIGGSMRIPRGGIVVSAPLDERATEVTIGGRRATPVGNGEVIVKQLPAEVIFSYRPQ
ncbi:MAG: discoidin domain-containing protein [Anaerolineae bacterium]|nr:discoidin domain-containing protein [Gemmatimonadaceae bacterium]